MSLTLDNKNLVNLSLLLSGLISCHAFSGELKIKGGVDTKAYLYETANGQESEFVSNEALVIKPSLTGIFSSKGLTASISAVNTIAKLQNDESADVDSDKQYTEFQYDSKVVLIENVMDITLNGRQRYRAASQAQSLVSDIVLAPGELTKFQTHNATFNFNTPNPKYIGLNFQANYAKSNSDDTVDDNNPDDETSTGYDGANLSSVIRLYQGRSAKNFSFDISTSYNHSEQRDLEDFESLNHDATIGVGIAPKLSFTLVGSMDEYKGERFNRLDLDSNSYGVGFNWAPKQNRNILITYNQLEENEDNTTNFIGLNTNWAFTDRTDLALRVSKKFYGNAYSFDFSHKLKNFRSSITYDEQVNTFGGLSYSNTSGLFVCEFGSTEFANCFQPSGTDYILKPGEEYININYVETDITEQTLLRKAGSLNLGYEKNKVKVSLVTRYEKNSYLESDSYQSTKSAILNFLLTLSHRTSIGLSYNLSRTQEYNRDEYSTIRNIGLDFNRKLTEDFSLVINARYLDRTSAIETDLVTDKRITLGLKYEFD
ncbi:hypothetical protein RS130_23055 [Paraglaciecola aquimarina]|uniref:TIGR03016 family PEP-CTERM system-associated outer membrane protein n=1 Tax=Paraglaciecola aquimarina TaxID=1235557 RepID=A0ABU3T295_9ALTE|nr:hypothetical protein [Paraglaciecola aquimarina]MDU0356386.1 hypothetical protein [Paraglaciecola aquimarina]